MQIGLKIWSVNPVEHRHAAEKLAAESLCDYVEIYIVPGTLDYIRRWQDLPLPKVIHAPHLAHDFNLADHTLRQQNLKIFDEVRCWADTLSSNIIICHGGTGGTPAEAVNQLANFHDQRIVLENKPFWQHPEQYPQGTDLHCRGAVFEEFAMMQSQLSCGFCHDLAHTVCMANALQLDWPTEIRRFETLNPQIYHISDLAAADDQLDMHTALGSGALDWQQALSLIRPDAMLTLETPKISNKHLDDFASEVKMIHNAGF